jgi:hypothetical protein
MSEPASQRRKTLLSATPSPSFLAGLASLLIVTLVLAVAARADDSAARPPASVAPKESVPTSAKGAAPTDPADLGRGLHYLQLAASTSDTAFAAALAAPALVLDLRLAPADPAAESRLRELLSRSDATRPLFILLGPDTPAALRPAVRSGPGVLTLAGKNAGGATSVVIDVDPARDRAAAEALATGRPPRELIEEKIEKTRYDEEHLAHNRAIGHRDGDTDDSPAPAKPAANGVAAPSTGAEAQPAKPASPPLQDVLLQRALFIHRGLLALGRIPDHT